MRTSPPPSAEPVSAAPVGPPKRRRRRLLLTLAAISIGWKVLVLTVGAVVPRWLIDDGVSALPGELQPYARDAKRSAAALWNGPIERHGVVRTLRVVSVQRLPDDAVARRCGGLGARVRAYTYFGVPYSEARLVCDSGVVEYRVFRRRGGGGRPAPTAGPATGATSRAGSAPADVRGTD